MVKIADLKEGQVIKVKIGPMTRKNIKVYGKASKDTNAIHMSDSAAVIAKLKGVIQHGMLSYAHVIVYLDEWLGDSGKLRKITSEMRGMVRPGDMLEIVFTIKSISGKEVSIDWEQYSITPISISKDGNKVMSFEAEERGWISEKDIARNTIKEEELKEPLKWVKTVWEEPGFPDGKYTESIEEYKDGGTLKYRHRLSLKGTCVLELNE
ncbi:MAG: MaoC/PaaZ C-terminal domain-containing protein [Promethearchaeota archaeon]